MINFVLPDAEPPMFVVPDNVYDPSRMMMQFTPAVPQHDLGPFLSQGPIFSPLEMEFNHHRPGLAALPADEVNREQGEQAAANARLPSYRVRNATGYLLPYSVVPTRHISASSSPAPQAEAEQEEEQQTYDHGINDRSTSYDLAAEHDLVNNIPEMDITEDLFWSSFEMAPPLSDQASTLASSSNAASLFEGCDPGRRGCGSGSGDPTGICPEPNQHHWRIDRSG